MSPSENEQGQEQLVLLFDWQCPHVPCNGRVQEFIEVIILVPVDQIIVGRKERCKNEIFFLSFEIDPIVVSELLRDGNRNNG